MGRINKIDYFCGAFLSYLISNNVEPTLFDAVDKSKVVRFTQKNMDYNIYLKYVSTCIESKVAGKEQVLWNITFSQAENTYIRTKFKQDNRENKVVLVCAKPNLQDTCVAVLSLDDALECLGADNINKQRRISVKYKKTLIISNVMVRLYEIQRQKRLNMLLTNTLVLKKHKVSKVMIGFSRG